MAKKAKAVKAGKPSVGGSMTIQVAMKDAPHNVVLEIRGKRITQRNDNLVIADGVVIRVVAPGKIK